MFVEVTPQFLRSSYSQMFVEVTPHSQEVKLPYDCRSNSSISRSKYSHMFVEVTPTSQEVTTPICL